MAKNTNTNNRIAIKWIRDRAKAAYIKQERCSICNTTEDLELHHLGSLTLLLNKWAHANNHAIDTDEQVLSIRDEFIELHHKEIYEDVETLCNKHHVLLHSVFGKSPLLSSVDKQRLWIDKQKARLVDGYVEEVKPRPEIAWFSAFY